MAMKPLFEASAIGRDTIASERIRLNTIGESGDL